MQKISEEGRGVLVVIRQSQDNKSLVELIHRYQLEDNGILPSVNLLEANDWRMTGTGARILADLGVHKLKVLGTHKKYVGLSGFDLEVSEHVGLGVH
jgi:3,4-dihydroxy 2-butanone 4-phosphate synthase/GTP cyclohydrolase II